MPVREGERLRMPRRFLQFEDARNSDESGDMRSSPGCRIKGSGFEDVDDEGKGAIWESQIIFDNFSEFVGAWKAFATTVPSVSKMGDYALLFLNRRFAAGRARRWFKSQNVLVTDNFFLYTNQQQGDFFAPPRGFHHEPSLSSHRHPADPARRHR
jgi:hypothetical protein